MAICELVCGPRERLGSRSSSGRKPWWEREIRNISYPVKTLKRRSSATRRVRELPGRPGEEAHGARGRWRGRPEPSVPHHPERCASQVPRDPLLRPCAARCRNGTTRNSITNGVQALLQHPEELRKLADDPSSSSRRPRRSCAGAPRSSSSRGRAPKTRRSGASASAEARRSSCSILRPTATRVSSKTRIGSISRGARTLTLHSGIRRAFLPRRVSRTSRAPCCTARLDTSAPKLELAGRADLGGDAPAAR